MKKKVEMSETEWLESRFVYRMLEYLRDSNASSRKVRLFACACCRHIWHLLVDKRSRAAVEVSERMIDGLAIDEDLERVICDAEEASWQSKIRTASEAAFALINPAFPAMGAAMKCAMKARDAEDNYSGSWNRYYLERDPNSQGDHVVQSALLHDIFGNPFRPVRLDPRWQSSTVLDLARTIYDDRKWERMPILADALMDAGCDSEEIIEHCQGPGPHVRGCWVVDLLLAKA